MAPHRSRVSEAQAGRRLDVVVASLPGVETRSIAERLVVDGAVLVNGIPRPKSHRMQEGDCLEVALPVAVELTPRPLALDVVFADEYLLVVEKPAGLVVHPAPGADGETLVHGVLALGAAGGDPARPGIVHRLDRDTSGLLIVARSEEAYARLSSAIRERLVERRYLALVRGTPRSRTGRINAPIGRDRHDRTRRSLDTDSPRDVVTVFEIRERLDTRTLLETRLETGRTHQIRVHLESIGLPVSGDPTYGAMGDLGLGRQFLHAHALAFDHPFTGTRMELESGLPPDLTVALDRARAEVEI